MLILVLAFFVLTNLKLYLTILIFNLTLECYDILDTLEHDKQNKS